MKAQAQPARSATPSLAARFVPSRLIQALRRVLRAGEEVRRRSRAGSPQTGLLKRLQFESLEPRFLLSADLNPASPINPDGQTGDPQVQSALAEITTQSEQVTPVIDLSASTLLAVQSSTEPLPLVNLDIPSPSEETSTSADNVITPKAETTDELPIAPLAAVNLNSTADVAANRIEGSLDLPGEIDRYTFTLERDVAVYFDSLTSNSNITWSLTSPRGAVVSNRSFNQSDSYNDFSQFDLPAGDYLLTVDSLQDATGAYAFRLLDADQGTVIEPGIAVNGQLNPANETDIYRFDATAGERLYFDSQSGSDIYWRLLDPYHSTIKDFSLDKTSG